MSYDLTGRNSLYSLSKVARSNMKMDTAQATTLSTILIVVPNFKTLPPYASNMANVRNMLSVMYKIGLATALICFVSASPNAVLT